MVANLYWFYFPVLFENKWSAPSFCSNILQFVRMLTSPRHKEKPDPGTRRFRWCPDKLHRVLKRQYFRQKFSRTFETQTEVLICLIWNIVLRLLSSPCKQQIGGAVRWPCGRPPSSRSLWAHPSESWCRVGATSTFVRDNGPRVLLTAKAPSCRSSQLLDVSCRRRGGWDGNAPSWW